MIAKMRYYLNIIDVINHNLGRMSVVISEQPEVIMGLGCVFPNLAATKNWLLAACLALAVLVLAGPEPGFAQSGSETEALKSEMQALKQSQAAIQKDLAEIMRLLKQRPQAQAKPQRPAFEPRDLDIAGAPYLGQPDATVTLVEFTDYQCPYCRRHFERTQPELVKNYVEAGKLKYVLREFPLAPIHPKAFKASEAALCAGDQGKYWEMHDLFFQDQQKLGPEDLKAHAGGLGLEMAGFSECLDGGKYTKRIENDLAEGAKAGVRGTPTFFLGLTDPTDPTKIRATKSLQGAQPYVVFKQVIDALIAQGAKGS